MFGPFSRSVFLDSLEEKSTKQKMGMVFILTHLLFLSHVGV